MDPRWFQEGSKVAPRSPSDNCLIASRRPQDLVRISSHRCFSACLEWGTRLWISNIRLHPRQFRLAFENLFEFSAAAQSFVSLRVGHSFAHGHAEWRCQVRGIVFASKHACAVHSYRKHGITCNIRYYVTTNHCLCCLNEWHIRDRLIGPLRDKAPACCRYYGSHIIVISKPRAEELDNAAIQTDLRERVRFGVPRHNACDSPVYRLEGPQPISFITGCGSREYGRNLLNSGNILGGTRANSARLA